MDNSLEFRGRFCFEAGIGYKMAFGKLRKEEIIFLPDFYWQGVIIAYRIPRPKVSINITPYVEG